MSCKLTIMKSLIKINVLLILLFVAITGYSQTNNVTTHASRGGIWVLCGDQLPKDFTYRILRQKNKDNWVKLADLAFPKSKEQVQAETQLAQKQAGLDVEPLTDVRLNFIWERLNDAVITNIPLELKDNYPIRSASGNAWFDANADSAVNYTYKVQIVNRKDVVLTENESKITAYPAKPFANEIIPLTLK
jgi:hypothetical protein